MYSAPASYNVLPVEYVFGILKGYTTTGGPVPDDFPELAQLHGMQLSVTEKDILQLTQKLKGITPETIRKIFSRAFGTMHEFVNLPNV